MKLENDLILRAARGERIERAPVWLMRQAGRILPEYREVRNQLKDFRELVKTPEKACEVTIQPVDLLGVDAAIIFSDILVIPEAMGLPYEMKKGVGPVFPRVISDASDVKKLKESDPRKSLDYVMEAIRLTKNDLKARVPLIGFAGAPWTIFCYMIEGGGSKTFSKARRMIMEDPALARGLLDRIAELTGEYLIAQVEAGADMVQVFDSWAGVLGPETYKNFALPGMKKIVEMVKTSGVPITLFAKGAQHALPDLASLDCHTLGLDWTIAPESGRKLVGPFRTLQGNLDPAMLYSPDETIQLETLKMLERFGEGRHIANLGHGVYPDTDPAKVKVFIETVKSFKYSDHA